MCTFLSHHQPAVSLSSPASKKSGGSEDGSFQPSALQAPSPESSKYADQMAALEAELDRAIA
jgi:hypothetical protein